MISLISKNQNTEAPIKSRKVLQVIENQPRSSNIFIKIDSNLFKKKDHIPNPTQSSKIKTHSRNDLFAQVEAIKKARCDKFGVSNKIDSYSNESECEFDDDEFKQIMKKFENSNIGCKVQKKSTEKMDQIFIQHTLEAKDRTDKVSFFENRRECARVQ